MEMCISLFSARKKGAAFSCARKKGAAFLATRKGRGGDPGGEAGDPGGEAEKRRCAFFVPKKELPFCCHHKTALICYYLLLAALICYYLL